MSPISRTSGVATLIATSSNPTSEYTREGLNDGELSSRTQALNDPCSFSNARNIAHTDSESCLFKAEPLSTSPSQESSEFPVASGRFRLDLGLLADAASFVSAASGHGEPPTAQEKERTDSNYDSDAVLCSFGTENEEESETGLLSKLSAPSILEKRLEINRVESNSEKPNEQVCNSIINIDMNQICGERLTEEKQIIKKKKIPIAESSFFCSICKKNFRDQYSVRRHMVVHNEVRDHLCDICNKGFKTSEGLMVHIGIHRKSKNNVCSICKETFQKESGIIEHMHTHRDKKPYLCETCDKRFSCASGLSRHKGSHSKDNRSYSCTVCGKSFKQNHRLLTHIRIHNKVRYSCDLCDKKVVDRSALKTHMETHAGVRGYSCNICGNAYIHNSSLLRHKNTHV